MTTFDFRGFARFSRRFLTASRWTPRRTAINLAYLAFLPPIELAVWTGLLLDELLFPGYRREPVEGPVFIAGNPRSGTTFLHRLMARDESFTTMAMWEALLAPSITQRRLTALAGALDRALGRPLGRCLARVEAGWREDAPMHEISFRAPEEDDYVLLHAWSALTIGLSSGLLDEARPYLSFDTALAADERRRIMGFYRRCLQRHVHAERRTTGAGRRYLAKNPALSPKLASVFEHFPDAKVIYLVRNPLEMLPSYLSMMRFSWEALGSPARASELADWLLEMAAHWYRYPLEVLARAPEEAWAIVRYDDLVAEPERTVRQVYARLGLPLRPAFEATLREATARASRFRSRHEYSLEESGLTRERIVAELGDVFERFGFPTGEDTSGATSTLLPTSAPARA